jgi:ElaB/YqjD/DUF883 family membrane-anchored ribosome-binding protein
MAELDTIRKELEKLLKEVKSLQAETAKAGPSGTQPAAAAPEAKPDVDAATETAAASLRELEQVLTEKMGEAEDALQEHPIAAMAAAFLLGLVIGRFSLR